MESTDLIPMDGDVAKITKRAEEFRELPDALQRNLQTFLALTMDVLAAVHQKVKASSLPDATRQAVRIRFSCSSRTGLGADCDVICCARRLSPRCAKSRGRSSSLLGTSSTGCRPMCTRILPDWTWRSRCDC